jgi:hypothetical protein
MSISWADAVHHAAVLGTPVGGEVHRRLGVDGDEGGVAAGDQELVVVPWEAFAGLEPRYLLVGVVEDHVLPVAEAAVDALPPRKYRLAAVALGLEVHGVPLFGAHGAQPHRLALVIEDHGPVLGRVLLPRPVLRGGEEVSRGRVPGRCGHLDRGGPQVRARAVDPRRPRRRRRGHRPDGPVRLAAGQRQNREPRATRRNPQKVPPRLPHAQPFVILPLAATQTGHRPEAAILLRQTGPHTRIDPESLVATSSPERITAE